MRGSGVDKENLGTEGGGRLAPFQSDLDLELVWPIQLDGPPQPGVTPLRASFPSLSPLRQ